MVAKRADPDLTPAQWLWMQTDVTSLSYKCFNACLALSEDGLNVDGDDENEAIIPLFLLDESQRLLVHDDLFLSRNAHSKKISDNKNRPLGYATLGWLDDRGLGAMSCGTNLRLKDFAYFRSAAGGEGSYRMMYDFDFHELPAIKELFNFFLTVPDDMDLDDVAVLLQGRPRFVAQAICECIKNGKPEEIKNVIINYTSRMMTGYDEEQHIGTLWKRLYAGGNWFDIDGDRKMAWDVARDMLLASMCSSQSGGLFLGRTPFPLKEAQQLVSHGVSMIQVVDEEEKEVMAEPLVLSAGITFCAREEGVDFAAKLIGRFNDDMTDAHHRGKLLETLVAVRLFQNPGRLAVIENWPEDMEQPTRKLKGILLDIPLTDPRLDFSSLDTIAERKAPYWIGLPENSAGPNLVFPGALWSMKTSSTKKRIASAEARKSIKTITPSMLYTKTNGSEPDVEKVTLVEKRRNIQAAVANWTKPIARVRIELPKSSQGVSPSEVLNRDGKWHCNLHDVDNSERNSDAMLYISETNVKEILDISW